MTSRVVHKSELCEGMVVQVPQVVRDPDTEKWVPLSEMWPGHPATLRVDLWAWEDGESDLCNPDGEGGLDLNVCDYPEHFVVLSPEAPADRQEDALEPTDRDIEALRAGSAEPATIERLIAAGLAGDDGAGGWFCTLRGAAYCKGNP